MPAAQAFNIRDWYWIIGGDTTQVWSSAQARSVPVGDSGYVAFIAGGGVPQRISSVEELAAVFAQQYPAGMLTTYANARQWALATGGYTIALSGVTCLFETDPGSLTLITGKAVRLGQPNPPATIEWQFASGSVELTAADFMLAANAVADFFQGTFDTLLKVVLPGISAGTISSISQIDAATWPSNVHP